MSSFLETTLAECNRLSSEEAKSNNNENPALYTNKLGSGVKLNAGDSVSLHSAFISQQGAGGETIQFNGNTLTDNKGNPLTISLSKTKITYSNACYTDPPNASNTQGQVIYGQPNKEVASTETNPYILKDNEINLQISYYKTRNGELTVSLPRRFMSSLAIDSDTRPTMWKDVDEVVKGLPFKGQSKVNGGILCLTLRTPAGAGDVNYQYWVNDDYYFNKSSYLIADTPTMYLTSFFKLKSDNSRYKLFIQSDGNGMRKSGYLPAEDWYGNDSPSESIYKPYQDIITLTAPTGFSSPESIADSLTNQLRDTGLLQSLTFNEFTAPDLTNQSRQERPVSVFTESPCYKTFNAMNVNDHNASTYFSFYSSCLTQAGNTDSPFYYNQYLQNYQYIGIKRPDWYEKGCDYIATSSDTTQGSNRAYSRLLVDINASVPTDKLNASIILDQEWTTSNLNALKEFLDTQANYPELFENRFNNYAGITKVSNSRFLHMNLNGGQQLRLGGDNVNPVSFTGQVANENASSQNSVPLFFDFDPSASNTFREDTDINNKCYGFAQKYYHTPTSKYYISFSTSLMIAEYASNPTDFDFNDRYSELGIPFEYAYYSDVGGSGATHGLIVGKYNASGVENTAVSEGRVGRLIGFDKHFNSYGNAVIGLCDGYLNMDYQQMTHYSVNTETNNSANGNESLRDMTPYARKIYVGAQAPIVEYNGSNNKFNFNSLHTPEYIGNLWNAGINSETETNNTPINPNAQESVFHINKRLTNNNWTTDMMPYSQNYASSIESSFPNNTASQKYVLAPLNRAISPWKVFDSQSGIFIDSFGITEDAWDNSLMGKLGFSYSQFNSSISASFNYNTRLTEINKNNIPFTTTNADVNVADTINFMTNIFGANVMTSQVPLAMVFSGVPNPKEQPPFVDDRFVQSYPTITEAQQSILIEAENLPTKMTRAYYTIKSSLLDKYTYLGTRDSGQLLNTIGVVNKMNNVGDYFFQEDQGLSFTITNPKTITEIETHILEPDGSSAQINNDSCVIYKIIRNINSTLNPIDELLNNTTEK